MSQKEKLNKLQDRLDEIFIGIDDFYSQSILDELIKRIESTIDDFNNEFQSLIGNLNAKPDKKRTAARTPRKRATTKAARKTSTVAKSKSKSKTLR